MFLRIEHSTSYQYSKPVEFTPHTLRLMPKGSPGLHLVKSSITVSPQSTIRWRLNAEENIIGTASITGTSDHLLIESIIVLEQRFTNPFDFVLEERSLQLPIAYSAREIALLAPYLGVAETRLFRLKEWLDPFIRTSQEVSVGAPTTLGLLLEINRSIPTQFRYSQRHEYGVQSPSETLRSGEGTCRDFACLLMEAARSLGIAARYVSGYLCASAGSAAVESHTHGWCELYLPGAGWLGFDPTNGILTDAHHVPVATAVTPGEIAPVEGAYLGAAGECLRHDVSITAVEIQPWEIT